MSKRKINDGGWASRKLHLVIFAMCLVTGVAIAAFWLTAIQTIYTTFCSAILALAALYIGGNSAVKWIYSKNTSNGDILEEAEESEPKSKK